MSDLRELCDAEDAAFARLRERQRLLLEDALTVVAAQAPGLRKAGVSAIDHEYVAISLLPAEQEAAERASMPEEVAAEDEADPLFDPMTFGTLKVPGTARRAGKSTDEE